VKEYLSRKGVVFEDIDVTRNPRAVRELVEVHRSNMTPTIVIDGEVIIGFDPTRLDALLA
jgi:glutaredoxin 3